MPEGHPGSAGTAGAGRTLRPQAGVQEGPRCYVLSLIFSFHFLPPQCLWSVFIPRPVSSGPCSQTCDCRGVAVTHGDCPCVLRGLISAKLPPLVGVGGGRCVCRERWCSLQPAPPGAPVRVPVTGRPRGKGPFLGLLEPGQPTELPTLSRGTPCRVLTVQPRALRGLLSHRRLSFPGCLQREPCQAS